MLFLGGKFVTLGGTSIGRRHPGDSMPCCGDSATRLVEMELFVKRRPARYTARSRPASSEAACLLSEVIRGRE